LPKALEKRVGDLEEMVGDIPRHMNIRFDAIGNHLQAQDAQLKEHGERLNSLEAKIDALPRVLAEMITETLDERLGSGRSS
jgi:hypothetical protein